MRTLVILIALALAAALLIRHLERTRPQDLPWTPLTAEAPLGLFTRMKLQRLAEDPARCRAFLREAGVAFTPVPDRRTAPQCAITNAVALTGGIDPAPVAVACPLAAALAIWRAQALEPAARELLDARLTGVMHLGAYSCRRLYGRDEGPYSEHATANAIDIAGFETSQGAVSVLADWPDASPEAAFLRAAHAGACDLFGTTLGPDYNAAHADHLHLDMKAWGMGYGVCR